MKGSSINKPQVPLLSPIEYNIEDDRQNNESSGEGFNPLYEKSSEQQQDVLNSSKIFIPLSTPHYSFGSSASTDHLGFESQLLEVAIRTNDVSKVKHFLMIHRDKFQINSKPPEKDFNFNLQNQDININLQPTKIQTARSDQNDSSRSSLSLDDQALLPFKNALHTAIDNGSLDVVRTLLENGIDPNVGGHLLTDLDVPPQHSPSGSSEPSERCNVQPATIQCEIDEGTGFDIHDIYHYDTEIRSMADDARQDEDVVIAVAPARLASPSPNPVTAAPAPRPPAAMVVAVAEGDANRSVLTRQRSLSLDNDKPTKKNRPLLQKLRAGCSKLIRSAPSDVYAGHEATAPAPQQTRPAIGGVECSCLAADCMPPKGAAAGPPPVEFKGIMSELRRSSDVVRAILWNLSFRDTYSSGNVSDMDSSTELDVNTLFDRHEQRRYADYELENGGRLPLLDSLSSLQSFQSLSSTGSPTVPAGATSGGSAASVPMADDCPAAVPVVVFDHAPSTAATACPTQQAKPVQSSARPSPPGAASQPPSTTTTPPPIMLPDAVSSQPSAADTDDVLTVVPKIIFKIKSSLSLDRMNEMADMYTKQYLMTLPPLFLAVVRQNPTMIYLLLKFGGSPNVQDIYGNTPLHLAIVQPEISWNCVLDLLEFGAKICIKNATDICPSDIVDSLLRIQVHMINDCWKILSGSTAVIKERMWRHNFINSYDPVGKPSDLPTLHSRLFRRMKFTQTDSAEERHSSNLDDFLGSIWSLKSRISNKTPETDEVRNNVTSQPTKIKTDKKTIINDYGIKHKNSKALKLYNIERKFQVISHLSGNVECLGLILHGLNNYIVDILKYLEANHDLSLRHICTLLKTILNVAVMEFGEQGKKEELSVILCSVMKVCLSALQGIHHVQFTAMAIINRIIDISVQYNVSFIKAVESDYLHHPHYVSEMNKYKSSKDDSSIDDDKMKPDGPNKKLTSMWRYFIGDQFNNKTENSKMNKNTSESVIGVLSNVHVLSIINVLHNSLTLYKRVIGSKRLCPPSHRSSQCSYHCLQILSARTLLFMSLNDDVKSELVKEPQLKILAASLESTNDPQLLVLVLQIIASIALNTKHHRELIDRDIPNVLNQLLLPSDEWYYTNHSDKYGRYVKHHAAKVLVYLGFSYRINISIFDMYQDLQPNPPITKTYEDNYIAITSLSPSFVLNSDESKLLGVSIETAIINVLKEIEQSLSQSVTPSEVFTLHWALNGKSYSLLQNNASDQRTTENKYPTDVRSSLFVQTFVACAASTVDPVILVRLLANRLVTTPLYPRNSSSITSMSGQDPFPPRTTRSRASSTDTNASTRKKRFNLSLDTTKCYGYDPVDGIPSKGKSKSVGMHTRRRRSSTSSAGGFGIEPALQATFNAFSNIIKHDIFKDNMMSPDIDTDEYRNSSVSLTSTKALPGVLNFQFPPRNRPSLRSGNIRNITNERSKSQANITKMRGDSYQQTPEQEILAFQKQLQNLPDLDSPNHVFSRRLPLDSTFATVPAEFIPTTRPRSRSMPRVAYESNRYLTLPDSFPFTSRLPRGRSAGTLGFQTEYHGPCGPMVISNQASSVYNSYPVNSYDMGNNAACSNSIAGGVSGTGALSSGSGNTYNSRRSSYSPSDKSRGRDSIAFTHGGEVQIAITPWHRSILILFETWLRTSKTEFNDQHALCVEMREFMRIVNHIGGEYSQWYIEMVTEFKELSIDIELKDGDTVMDTNKEYSKLQSAVIAGTLQCSSDEAIGLAGLQFRIEKTLERRNQTPDSLTANSPDSLLDGGGPCTTLHPISEDKEHHWPLDVPAVVTPSPVVQSQFNMFSAATITSPTVTDEPSVGKIRNFFLRSCQYLCFGRRRQKDVQPVRDPFGILHKVHMYVPPDYRKPKNTAKLIKELKKIVAHTLFNDSELQLKRIYVERCKRLPAFGCHFYFVKEVQRGRTKTKAARLLGLSLDKIVLLDNKTKILSKCQNTQDLLEWQTVFRRNRHKVSLEFRNSKWTLATPTERSLREIAFVLLKILQEIDTNFLELHSVIAPNPPTKPLEFREINLDDAFASELDSLRRILHFPEEVAILLSDRENDLFYDVPPIDFLRQVTLDQDGANACNTSVKNLIERFNAVSAWTTHLIITRPTHEDRKAILSCLLRVAKECWNIGNFNGAMEIIAGLKSEKIRPFMQTVLEKEKVSLFYFLTDTLSSTSQYDNILQKALAMPDCPVVPFFGSFMREIRKIMKETPSTIVLSDQDGKVLSETLAEHEYLDGYTTSLGLDGIVNMEKIYKVQSVLEELSDYHRHYFERKTYEAKLHLLKNGELQDNGEEDNSQKYDPVQSLAYDHGVSLIPLATSPSSKDFTIGHHELQIMHHGTTVVHWAAEMGSRSARIFMRLERNCSTLTWEKTSWSALKRSSGTPDYSLKTDPEDSLPNALRNRSSVNCPSVMGLQQGYLELSTVRDIFIGGAVGRDRVKSDGAAILRKYSLNNYSISECCLGLVYGTNTSENRIFYILAPPRLLSIWHYGLKTVVQKLRNIIQTVDKRSIWLKNNYVHQYIISGGRGPMTADAIRLFGGRDWSTAGNAANNQSSETSIAKRAASMRFRKKKSVASVSNDGLLKPYDVNDVFNKSRIDLVSSGCNSPSTLCSQTVDEKKRDSVYKNIISEPSTSAYKAPPKIIEPTQSDINNSPILPNISQLDFEDFCALFDSFSLRMRKDLRDIFDQVRAASHKSEYKKSEDIIVQNSATLSIPRTISEQTQSSSSINKNIGNNCVQPIDAAIQKKRIFDAIAASSIISNCTGVETSQSAATWSTNDLINFLKSRQMISCTEDEAKILIQIHESNPEISARNCLSFEGFAKYMMLRNNTVFSEPDFAIENSDMNFPLSCYYIASSHNTYLTGHQLKGDSSIDLYSRVLLAGCRCVELDCWDGDDGNPLIYHGHTFTSKIPFLGAVDSINRFAFVSSPYPVILSIENHCSLVQQARMAEIFESVFGEKLVKGFTFDSDYEPQLPSPSQLKYKILIKNKKISPLESEKNRMKNNNSSTKSSQIVSSLPSNYSNAGTSVGNNSNVDSSGAIKNPILESSMVTKDPTVQSSLNTNQPNIELSTASNQTNIVTSVVNNNPNVMPSVVSSHPNIGPHRSSSASAGTTTNDDVATTIEEEEEYEEDDEEYDDSDELDFKKFGMDKLGKKFSSKSNDKYAAEEKFKKHNSQIAKELSDIVIYTQAIKFRGLNTRCPSSSMKNKRKCNGSLCGQNTSTEHYHSRGSTTINPHHSCFKCSSLSESNAKKLTKKRPLDLIAHAETQLVRVYPASMRIDSSNFNPLNFWSYGVQMAALNYQSEEATASHVNAAMFEQNGHSGYVLKPRVMHDPSHKSYRQFNPMEKNFDGLNPICFTISIVSGQYLSPNGGIQANVYVEIEIIGIPSDSLKKKSKTIFCNSMNPMWDDTFSFNVLFKELAFIRFLIVDASTNHALAQRVLPLKSMLYGYRHIDMHNMRNRPLPLSALFVCTCSKEEVPRSTDDEKASSTTAPAADNGTMDSGVSTHRKKFHVLVFGVFSENSYITFKVTQDSTATDLIRLALNKRNEGDEEMKTYVLLEEVGLTWDVSNNTDNNSDDNGNVDTDDDDGYNNNNSKKKKKKTKKKKTKRIGWKNGDAPMMQRVLDYDEKLLEAQSRWRGNGYFVLKKIGDDPSSRAWLISLQCKNSRNGQSESSWDEIHTFLVCIYNISEERSYVILKVPAGSTAQDILAQILVKARRLENPILFILVEEQVWGRTDIRYRVLDDDEVVYNTQNQWSRVGKFVLEDRCSDDDDDDDGLVSKTSRAWETCLRVMRIRKGMAAFSRGWRACGLPTLPGHCLRYPENDREYVIKEAARIHRKMLEKNQRMWWLNLEKGGSGDGGGGLERGCDDDGSGGEDAEESIYSGFIKSPAKLFGFLKS